VSYIIDWYKLPEDTLRDHLSTCTRIMCPDCRSIVQVLGVSVECPECERIICVCDMEETADSAVSLGLEGR